MKSIRFRWCLMVLVFMVAFPCALLARDAGPVVSADWVEKNLANPKLKLVDIRKLEEYKDGHIPGSLSAFYGIWAVKRGTNQNELPAPDDLTDAIRALGIEKDSLVVVVGKTDTPSDLVGITRVAWTLIYGGMENVSILDGGYNKWLNDKKAVSKDITKAVPSAYQPVWNKNIIAAKDYMTKMMKQSRIVDTRLPDAFFGVVKLDFVARAGHVPGAVCLPSVWIFTKDGTIKSRDDLEAMASGVLGKDKEREIIIYCDTGKFCTGWWFILSEMLGYKNVKNYDGAMEEWAKDPQAPMVKYSW
jgi:thiosulfate/3-mercaptopyruvate sulfurtransferase